MTEKPYEFITESQRQFVVDRRVMLDNRGWATDYQENLFAPLHPDSVADFERAGELTPTSGGRIAAPHSSTAFAINVFDVWRGSDLTPLGDALGFDLAEFVGYEHGHSLGFQRPAQPDIEFTTSDGTALAVEVKLREPYGKVSNEFADRYFETPELWDGLPNLRNLAGRMDHGEVEYLTLHAAQLIKHALGLHRSYGDDFVLGYLWLYVPGTDGNQHLRELEEFTAVAASDIDFVPVTVQELLDRLDGQQCDPAWLTYMTERYVTPLGQ